MPIAPTFDIKLDENGAVISAAPLGRPAANEPMVLDALRARIAEHGTTGTWSKNGRTFKAD